ncbi:hypothetical protein LS73_007265 [Helicobacter muridarum]|uniref:Uncharacterized protein n=1 Tax=Helicobacter muridarum TaxID=216 RepID=A0A099TZL4_9HELI|nr:hypothetical protein [Helicobacter muridarum]TLD99568.1 hypothetical protein LS73_007265 [Helicobacter muridarum]STQ85908.1 Uncharacterised protein [Helicobacter muridarum]
MLISCIKRAFTLFIYCAALYGFCFARGSALDFVNESTKLFTSGEKRYYCSGDSKFASCEFLPIGDDDFNINNLVLELKYPNQDMMTSLVSGEFNSYLSNNFLFPKSFVCENSTYLKKDTNVLKSDASCTIKSESITMNIDVSSFVVSDIFRYKDIYFIQLSNTKRLIEFQNRLIQYIDNSENFGSIGVLYEIFDWLNYYNLGIKEIKINIHAPNLSNYFLDENIKRYDNKTQAYQAYYSNLEFLLASYKYSVNNNKKLNSISRKNLDNILSDFAKLLDPNSHKRSIKILVRGSENETINLGQFLIMSFYGNNFMDNFYSMLNKYDIRSVTHW